MTVSLLVIAHENIGSVMIDTVAHMLGNSPLSAEVIAVPPDCDPDLVFAKAEKKLSSLDNGDGVLVLTDIYGSTPGNIASKLDSQGKVKIVAGLNLPMLIRVMNYPKLNLDKLAEKAVSGGRDGVIICQSEKND